jgi:hypothetical protein
MKTGFENGCSLFGQTPFNIFAPAGSKLMKAGEEIS